MRRIKFWVFLPITLIFGCSDQLFQSSPSVANNTLERPPSEAPKANSTTTAAASTYLSSLEQQVIMEMNKVRTNPKGYIPVLESYKQRFQGKRVKISNQFFMQTNEGPKAVDEAIAFLQSARPLSP